jgi:hypothetical protein
MGMPLPLGFTLDVKPGEEIVGLLFVIGVKKEEGSYTYFIGIIIILHLRSRCKTPPPPTPCDLHMFWFKLPFALCFTMVKPIGKGHSENVDKLRFWESNYRPFCISYFILFYCISIFLYIVSISKKLKIKTYQLSISMSNLYLLVINLFKFLGK